MKNKELIKVLKRFPPDAALKNAFMENGMLKVLYVGTDGIEFSISICIADSVDGTADKRK